MYLTQKVFFHSSILFNVGNCKGYHDGNWVSVIYLHLLYFKQTKVDYECGYTLLLITTVTLSRQIPTVHYVNEITFTPAEFHGKRVYARYNKA